MNNREKRDATVFVGLVFIFLNAVFSALWYFEVEPTNKLGIAFVWGLVDVVLILIFGVVITAEKLFPRSKDND